MQSAIQRLLDDVAGGRVSAGQALESLKHLPSENIGIARLDHHRIVRVGLPEVVYGEGKTPNQIVAIVRRLTNRGHPVLVTRLSAQAFSECRGELNEIGADDAYDPVSRTWVWSAEPVPVDGEGTIIVAAAGTSDLPVAEEAVRTGEAFGNRVERLVDVGVAGLHRLLEHVEDLRKARVIIAVAGMEGALPSVIAGLVPCPVIAVPTSVGYGSSFGGLAALLAMLNSCSVGVTVVNIDNGFGAACAASLINHPTKASTPGSDGTSPEAGAS